MVNSVGGTHIPTGLDDDRPAILSLEHGQSLFTRQTAGTWNTQSRALFHAEPLVVGGQKRISIGRVRAAQRCKFSPALHGEHGAGCAERQEDVGFRLRDEPQDGVLPRMWIGVGDARVAAEVAACHGPGNATPVHTVDLEAREPQRTGSGDAKVAGRVCDDDSHDGTACLIHSPNRPSVRGAIQVVIPGGSRQTDDPAEFPCTTA